MKYKRSDILDIKKNPWFNWTYPDQTPHPVCVSCGKECKSKEDKIYHSWARLCKKCHKKTDRLLGSAWRG